MAGHLLLPADVDEAGLGRRLDAVMLEVVLLQVDEGRHAVAGLGQQVEFVDLARVEEHLARAPGDALVEQGLRHAQPVHDLERALRPADGAAAVGEVALLVDDDAAVAPAREVERGGEPHRPRTDDHDGVVRRLRRVLIGRAGVGEPDVSDVGHGAGFEGSDFDDTISAAGRDLASRFASGARPRNPAGGIPARPASCYEKRGARGASPRRGRRARALLAKRRRGLARGTRCSHQQREHDAQEGERGKAGEGGDVGAVIVAQQPG